MRPLFARLFLPLVSLTALVSVGLLATIWIHVSTWTSTWQRVSLESGAFVYEERAIQGGFIAYTGDRSYVGRIVVLRANHPRMILWYDKRLAYGLNPWEYPLWPVVVLLAAATAFAWRARRHARRCGLCTKCGYDRRGLVHDTACPECGTMGKSS